MGSERIEIDLNIIPSPRVFHFVHPDLIVVLRFCDLCVDGSASRETSMISRRIGWTGAGGLWGFKFLVLSMDDFIAQRRSLLAVDHKAVYGKTIRMMNSKYKDIFNLQSESAAVREAYGHSSFGSGCLMARRLVEQGVTYVEV